MRDRVKALQASFRSELDGYIITDLINMLYLTDFLGAATMFVPNEGESTLYIHDVNFEAGLVEAKNCRVKLAKRGENLIKNVSEQIMSQKLSKLGFDKMNVQTYEKFRKYLKNTRLEAKSEYIWKLRRVKDEDELKKIRKAGELTVEGMRTAFEAIKKGLKEYEVAAEIEYAMRTCGSYGVAFDTIVASGPRSAYPHGGCGERKLRIGDLVVVDFGAIYKNYRADMTRTFVVGKATTKQRKYHAVVALAQEKAFQKIQDGVKATEPDMAARETISREGYEKYFVHGLGHGIGLETHEQPTLNPTSKDILEAGNVVTDEPGIYIVGFGGFRIEDTILVKKDIGERLTSGLHVLEAS
ncbi:MAG: aminopeptidase P family protein [Candidatus Bathyarchaeota archaeon]|nr:MAG: aminopeptidase P family protein [Candidatus Bathyarchaeota archaeon]